MVSVGTPGQDFRVLPSTKGGVTYLIAPEGCLAGIDPADCAESRGAAIFNSAQNSGFQTNVSTSWSDIGQYEVDLEEALNYTAKGLFGFDRVHLGPAAVSTSLQMDRQVVAGIADLDYYMGLLPLGTTDASFSSLDQSTDSLLFQLRNSSKIPSLSFGYTAGAKYRSKSVFGNLVLGGYDSTRFTPNANGFSFTFSQDPSRLLTVGVNSILASNTLRGTFSLTSDTHFSVIDSTVPHLWLPEDVCAQFESAFGLTYDPKTDLYLVNDTIHTKLLANNPTITLKLVNSLQGTSVNYTNIQLPYAAFDLQASYPYYQNATNYFPIRRAANDTQYVLGRTLLQEAYLIVDYERANFTLSQAVFPEPLPAAKLVTITPSTSPPTTPSSSRLSTGATIGIALGATALAALLALLAFFLLRKRRTQHHQRYELAGAPASSSSAASMHHTPATTPSTRPSAPFKAPDPQELSGTPLTELASPSAVYYDAHGFPQDRKAVISVNDQPQELHAESRTPVTPRWQEVTSAQIEMEGRGGSASSAGVSRVESGVGDGVVEGVSPMTGQGLYHGPR